MSRVGFMILCAALIATAAPVAAATVPDGVSPSPSRQPSFHRSQASGAVVGHLEIPAIGLSETVRAGVSLTVIDRGVAHWVGTASPGGDGNVVLAGHRTTHSAPFRELDDVVPGDLVFLAGAGPVPAVYRVTEAFVVDPDDVWITYDVAGERTLTMFACHPEGSERHRIVVRAVLVGGGRIA